MGPVSVDKTHNTLLASKQWHPKVIKMRLHHVPMLLLIPAAIALLCGCSTGYQEVDGKCAFVTWDEGNGRRIHFLKGADPSTFKIVAKDTYAKDKSHVYYMMDRIENAEAASFEALANPVYAKDNKQVFLRGIAFLKADPATFQLLTFPYSRDRTRAFCGTLPMAVHRLEAFEGVREGTLTETSTDPKEMMFREEIGPVKGVSKGSPVIVGINGWARDGMAYYYGPVEIKGTDYASFTVLNEYYAKDKRTVYWEFRPLPLVDSDSFVVTNGGGKDKNGWVRGDEVHVEVKVVKKFLGQVLPNAGSQLGPSLMTTKSLETAYRGSRFYYFVSPNGPTHQLTLSAIVQLDPRGQLHLVKGATDYNEDLMKIRGADDATTAASAIMSLLSLEHVDPQQIMLTKAQSGWTAQASTAWARWNVDFDEKGRCTSVDYKYVGPPR